MKKTRILNIIKILILAIAINLSVNASAETKMERLEVSKQLTNMAQQSNVLITFSIDPNDDKTLFLTRESNLRPNELKGDWSFYLLSIGATKAQLIESGFNKVRIYTTQSKDITDYVLKML